MKEALIAIASVSAVFWTGGLIILQIHSTDDSNDYSYLIAAAMAPTAFGALAPLLTLISSSEALRIISGSLGVLYLLRTWQSLRLLFARATFEKKLSRVGYLLPTLALFVLAAFPKGRDGSVGVTCTALWRLLYS